MMTTSPPEALGLGQAAAGDRDGIGRLGEDADADLGPEHTQLLDGRRALQVGADQIGMAPLLAEPAGQLGGGGGLAGALQAGEQHDGRGLRRRS